MSDFDRAAPDAPSVPCSGKAARRAWMWVGAYAVVELCLYIYFEWRNTVSGAEDYAYPVFDGFAFLFFLGASLVLFIRSLSKREKAAALIYAALLAIGLGWPKIGDALDLPAKAYFFSVFPHMCPEGSPKPGYRVFLCYKYWFMESRTALVFNPGDELAAPYASWPPEFDKEIFRYVEPTVVVPAIEECRKKKTRLLVRHVYLVDDHCWGATD